MKHLVSYQALLKEFATLWHSMPASFYPKSYIKSYKILEEKVNKPLDFLQQKSASLSDLSLRWKLCLKKVIIYFPLIFAGDNQIHKPRNSIPTQAYY